MGLQLLTPPSVEPVTLVEAKEHVRVDGDDDNAHLTLCITAAREYCEQVQNRAYISQAFRLTADSFPARSCESDTYRFDGRDLRDNRIELPRSPLGNVTSITYVDANGDTQTWSSSNYIVDNRSEPGRIVLAYSASSFPETRCQANAVTIDYVAGAATVFTADATSNVLTAAAGRRFTDGDAVYLTNMSGSLPSGLSTATTYYVRDASGSTFKLAATSGGSAIDITSAGSGTHLVGEVPARVKMAIRLLIGHWYENREAVLTGTVSKEIEFAVSALLTLNRVF